MSTANDPNKYSLADFAAQLDAALKENRELRAQLDGRLQSLMAVKQKLLEEEFDRKFREEIAGIRHERQKYAQALKELKSQLANCICGGSRRR
jgi:predicted  nucleic acid-binding Zn-ribbon protein